MTTSRETLRQERFGHVRSLLHAPGHNDGAWRDTLLALLETEHAVDPEGYAREWLPYLRTFSHLWQASLGTIRHTSELERLHAFAPFARWEARFDWWHDDEVSRLLDSPHLAHLHALSLHGRFPNVIAENDRHSADAPGALRIGQALRDAPSLTPLTRLYLCGLLLGDRAATALSQAPPPAALDTLELRYNLIGPQGAHALASSPLLHHLRLLDLHSNDLGPEGLLALAQSPHLARLESLDLSRNGLTPESLARVLRAPTLPSLHTLALSMNPGIGPDALALFAQAPRATPLRALRLSFCQLSSSGLEALAASPHLQLTSLDLSYNQIDDRGAIALSRSPMLAHLTWLDLGHNPIGEAGRAALTDSPYLPENIRLQW